MLDLNPASRNNVFRARRIALLRQLIGRTIADRGRCRLLDIGGTEQFWAAWASEFDFTCLSVTCINVYPVSEPECPVAPVSMVQGDARNLKGVNDGQFDVVFSNSVIEHVGGWRDMQAMASEVRRVAARYFVQTPYYWFPIEPHARAPLIQMMPTSWAYRLLLTSRLGFWERARTVDEAMMTLDTTRLLDKRQLRTLFPDAEIVSERFLGVTKSLFAIRA